jgi:molybdopterin-containing oxidoreductase family membrane subunit
MFLGTIGFFIFLMFLFIRFLPVINMFEVKDLLYKLGGKKEYVDQDETVEVK